MTTSFISFRFLAWISAATRRNHATAGGGFSDTLALVSREQAAKFPGLSAFACENTNENDSLYS